MFMNQDVCMRRAIEAAADACSDVVGMAYWWSNCIQLRWMLWAMCHGGEMSEDGSIAEDAQGMDEFDWVMKVCFVCFKCLPPLLLPPILLLLPRVET